MLGQKDREPDFSIGQRSSGVVPNGFVFGAKRLPDSRYTNTNSRLGSLPGGVIAARAGEAAWSYNETDPNLSPVNLDRVEIVAAVYGGQVGKYDKANILSLFKRGLNYLGLPDAELASASPEVKEIVRRAKEDFVLGPIISAGAQGRNELYKFMRRNPDTPYTLPEVLINLGLDNVLAAHRARLLQS